MLAVGVLVLHILTNFVTPYGFHRDELLYLAMGEHLRLWRMDFPPFIAIVARLSHELFGASLPGIRLAPAFAHAGLVTPPPLLRRFLGDDVRRRRSQR